MAALWLARAARAQEPEVWPTAPASAPQAQPQPQIHSQPPAPLQPHGTASPPATTRRGAFGYAAESARTATRLPPEEREARGFLRAAAMASLFELEASRLATERATGAGVRAYAAELMEYQEAAHLELLHLLHARGMALPMMDGAHRKALNRLARLSGPRFDREYVELLGQRHQREDVAAYERAVQGIADPLLRAWIERQLPNLRAQQMAAQRLTARPQAVRSGSMSLKPAVASRP